MHDCVTVKAFDYLMICPALKLGQNENVMKLIFDYHIFVIVYDLPDEYPSH